MPDTIESLLAVAIDNIADLQREVEKNREAIHKLRSTVRGVETLTRVVNELQESLPNLARQSAREAVEEVRRTRHADFFSNLRTYAAIFSAGAAVAALIVTLVLTR